MAEFAVAAVVVVAIKKSVVNKNPTSIYNHSQGFKFQIFYFLIKVEKDLLPKGCGINSSSCRNRTLKNIINFDAALLQIARTTDQQSFSAQSPKPNS